MAIRTPERQISDVHVLGLGLWEDQDLVCRVCSWRVEVKAKTYDPSFILLADVLDCDDVERHRLPQNRDQDTPILPVDEDLVRVLFLRDLRLAHVGPNCPKLDAILCSALLGKLFFFIA